MNHKTTRLLSVLIALFMVVLSIPVTALTNVEEIQTVNKEPLQEYDIIPNDSYVAESESVEQQLTSSSTINGVYAIRKANTNVYVQNNTLSSLSWVYQETNSTPPISSTDREFLFKIAYRSETNDYVIRSMLNNEIIIYPSVLNNAPVSGKVKVSGQPATDSNLSIKYTWKMTTTTDGYKYIWYNDGSTTYYIKSTSDTGGGPILKFTTNPNDTGTKWQFYQYTGAAINSTTSISYTNELMRGETFDFDVCMYSSTVGINGPIVYSVSEPDYSETDKATINSSSGLLTALKGGIIRVQWTYSGAPWIWSRLVTINFEDDIVHFFKNASSSLLFQPANADVGSYIVANTYSYSRTSMMWKFEYENGFYKIKNDVTGYYLRAPASNSEGAKISQST